MGQEVCRAIIAADGLELVAAVDPAVSGIDLRQVLGGDVPSLQFAGHIDVITEPAVEVVVDFSEASATRGTLRWCAAHDVHAVVGTTGLTGADMAEAHQLFAASAANAVIAPNFAIGAVLLLRFCELAAPWMESVEVIELHHDAKRDAPSGTALQTAARIAGARAAAGCPPLPPDPTTELVLPGARGGEAPGGVHVHSVRLPGLVAHEEVVFGAAGQSLTIRHDSYDRRSFMAGVVLAVREVAGRPGVTVGIEQLLGL